MAHSCAPAFAVCLVVGLLGVSVTGCSNSNQPIAGSSPLATPGTKSPNAATQNSPIPSASPKASLKPLPSDQPSLKPSPKPTAAIKPAEKTMPQAGVPDVSKPIAIAKQDPGKTYLSNLLLLQQTEKLVKGRFSSDLKGLAADVPTETEEYRIEMRTVDPSKAVMVAIAKQPGISSYTGVVYAVEAKIPVAGLCKTNVPSPTPPEAPKLVHDLVMCPQGSSAAH